MRNELAPAVIDADIQPATFIPADLKRQLDNNYEEIEAQLSKRDQKRLASVRRAIRLAEMGEVGAASTILARTHQIVRWVDATPLVDIAEYLHGAFTFVRAVRLEEFRRLRDASGAVECLALRLVSRQNRPRLLHRVLRLFRHIRIAMGGRLFEWDKPLRGSEAEVQAQCEVEYLVKRLVQQAGGHGHPITKTEANEWRAA